MGKTMYYVSGIVAAFAVGLGLGAKCNEHIRKGEAYVFHSIDDHLESSPRLKGVVEFFSQPRKQLQKYIHGQSEEEYQRNEQDYRNSIDNIVHESETQ